MWVGGALAVMSFSFFFEAGLYLLGAKTPDGQD